MNVMLRYSETSRFTVKCRFSNMIGKILWEYLSMTGVSHSEAPPIQAQHLKLKNKKYLIKMHCKMAGVAPQG